MNKLSDNELSELMAMLRDLSNVLHKYLHVSDYAPSVKSTIAKTLLEVGKEANKRGF